MLLRLLLMLVVVAQIVWAAPQQVIMIAFVEYQGPSRLEGTHVLVPAVPFFERAGWAVVKGAGSVSVGPSKAPAAPEGATGLFIEGVPFAGLQQTIDGTVWFSLNDFAKARKGRIVGQGRGPSMSVDVPGMPTPQRLHEVSEALRLKEFSKSPYTLAFFTITGCEYSKQLRPELEKFLKSQPRVRRVEVNLSNPGHEWIYLEKKSPQAGTPELILFNREGKILSKLVGATTEAVLKQELGPLIK